MNYDTMQTILKALPLERIRPEKRCITVFGSRMMATAALSRFVKMSDAPTKILHFRHYDVETNTPVSAVLVGADITESNSSIQPQNDVDQILQCFERLDEGSQFGVVVHQQVLNNTTNDVFSFFSRRARILEFWEFLEQSKFVVVGFISQETTKKNYGIYRQIFNGGSLNCIFDTRTVSGIANVVSHKSAQQHSDSVVCGETKTTIGQVLDFSEYNNQVYIYISRLMDDDDAEGEWIPLPQELPGWALDGTPFEAELSHDVKTFYQLKERPWALRHFRHTPRPYLTDDELDNFLGFAAINVNQR